MFKLILLSLLPSFIEIPIRRISGAKIGKNVKIKFGTIILANDVTIGDHVSIGPFTLIQGEKVVIGDYAVIGYLVSLRARLISIGYSANIFSNNRISGSQKKSSKFILGDHSSILPNCHIEPGEGITIGNKTGIGGNSLLFTHGSWPDHLDGGPVSFGPIVIEDNVWLPWRVFVLPNVIIGKNSVVGANSLVNKNVPEGSLVGGSPAKVLKEKAYSPPSAEERKARLDKIISEFFENTEVVKGESDFKIGVDQAETLKTGDLLFILNSDPSNDQLLQWQRQGIHTIDHKNSKYYRCANKNAMADSFKDFITTFGIRLYIAQPTHTPR